MHTYQWIHLCQSSFMPNGFLLGTSTSARGRVLGSLAFCVVCSCTWASTCMEPALVNLCSQWSHVVHMHVDPSCLLQCHSMFEHSFWVAPPPPTLPFFSTVYKYIHTIFVTGALLSICMGAHGWVATICQP